MSNQSVKKGFTLIELLVVIAIIAILAAILFPVFARAREKARQTTCSSNQRQIVASVQMYVQDHEETLPSTTSFWKDINVDQGVLVCPTAGKSMTNGYGYHDILVNSYDGSGRGLGDFPDPTAVIVTADLIKGSTNQLLRVDGDVDYRHSGKANASFLDGHVSAGTDYPILCLTAETDLMTDITPLALTNFPNTAGVWGRTGPDFQSTRTGTPWISKLAVDNGKIGKAINVYQKSYQNSPDVGYNIKAFRPLTLAGNAVGWVLSGYVQYKNMGQKYVPAPMYITVSDATTTIVNLSCLSSGSGGNNQLTFNGTDVIPSALFYSPAAIFTTQFVPFTISVDKSKAVLDFNGTKCSVTPTGTPLAPATLSIGANKQANSNMTIEFLVSDLKFGYK